MADLKQLEILKQGVDAWNRYVQLGVKINLSWADLEGAKLQGADLHAANLRWAKLKGADCRTVINDAGEREFTDLSETEGLTPWQIETMDGDRGVILPDHLTYPEDWPEPPESEVVPEQPEGPFVFISYAHDNKTEVAEITRYLRAHEINIWWDDGILPGDPWREQIQAVWKTVRRFSRFGPSRAWDQKVSLRRPQRGNARAGCSMPSWTAPHCPMVLARFNMPI